MPEISVDRDRCLGSGVCIVFAPHTFAHDRAARAVVVDPHGDPPDAIHSAIEGCPTSALRLEPDHEEPDQEEPDREGA
jgi:ferredoxin